MNYEKIQEKWLKTKDHFVSVLQSLRRPQEEQNEETEVFNQDEENTRADYNYESDSETGQRERYQ